MRKSEIDVKFQLAWKDEGGLQTNIPPPPQCIGRDCYHTTPPLQPTQLPLAALLLYSNVQGCASGRPEDYPPTYQQAAESRDKPVQGSDHGPVPSEYGHHRQGRSQKFEMEGPRCGAASNGVASQEGLARLACWREDDTGRANQVDSLESRAERSGGLRLRRAVGLVIILYSTP